uniref:Golgin candidate 4 n=1 Tax=Vitis vinifera TaxID=29760 RepID=F6I673_VITVI
MWSTIANLKENLNKIALDVHDDDDEELQIHAPVVAAEDPSVSDRRFSHKYAHSNGIDSAYNSEIEQYKAEIKRLQESEAEIKALSINYAALLKDKEDQISKLSKENGSLKHNLDSTNAVLSASRSENSRTSTNSLHALKGSGDQSPSRQHKLTAQVKGRSTGNQMHNGVVKQDGLSNGIAHAVQPDAAQSKMETKNSNLKGNEKELADLLEEKNRSLAALQATHELQIKQLRMELDKERDKLKNINLKLQEENKLNHSFLEDLNSLKMDKEKTSMEMNKIRSELNEKRSVIQRLQMELNRREEEEANDMVESLKGVIANLEKENSCLKREKDEMEVALRMSKKASTDKISPDVSDASEKHFSSLNEVNSSGSFPGKEEMQISLQQVERDLKEACQERDKALQELTRLKQHLLEKESEESEKMDEDSKIIEELRQNNEYQRAQILNLEKALKQAIARQDEIKMLNSSELQKSKEIIDDLNKKLASYMCTLDAKNVELLNLQTALGQYYAEMEAKERLERDLAHAREESAKLSELLKDASQQAELSKREKEEILAKLSQAETMLGEGKSRVNKLEEDNMKLRRALEQSMIRLNRMSMDSDYFVDRRIVVKLLVTYFQRNHSKEVLDLMVRMLGFSDEDKQRIGVAQQGTGKGVVRGVLGLPGRLVGGILGGSSGEAQANVASENQSFADLWVDFLLKETEERERREAVDVTVNPNPSSMFSHGSVLQSEASDSEFSNVPLTSAESSSRLSRLLPKY